MLSIAEKLRDEQITVWDAVDSGKIPEHILHTFACDCAERFIEKERKQRREIPPEAETAIDVKRRWIEDPAKYAEGLELAQDMVLNYAKIVRTQEDNEYERGRHLAWLAWDASKKDAMQAARDTLNTYNAAWTWRYSLPSYEFVWMIDHLTSLLMDYEIEQHKVILLLYKRALTIQQAFPTWQSELEDGLYQ